MEEKDETTQENSVVERTTYLQVRALVERLRRQHRRLRDAFSSQSEASGSELGPRSELLVGYLAEREDDFEDFLGRSQRVEGDSVLDTWIQYADLGRAERLVDELVQEPATAEPRETMARIAELDGELLRLSERLEAQVTLPAVQRFFSELSGVFRRRLERHAENLPQVEDL